MDLSPDDIHYYLKLEKGFEGELMFNHLLQEYPCDWLIINDLLLEKNNTTFQIDILLISQKKIFHFEVKNFEGDYFIDDNQWYTAFSKTGIINPISQLEKSRILLKRLLQDFGCHLPLESYLIFINPQFMLYNAPINPSIIFPAQLERFMTTKMNLNGCHMNKSHHRLGEKFISRNITDSKFSRVPSYNFEGLRKGVFCSVCYSAMSKDKEKNIICRQCGYIENWQVALMRSVDEYRLLFPDKKVTTNAVYEWCNGVKSTNTIRRTLIKNLNHVQKARSSYFHIG